MYALSELSICHFSLSFMVLSFPRQRQGPVFMIESQTRFPVFLLTFLFKHLSIEVYIYFFISDLLYFSYPLDFLPKTCNLFNLLSISIHSLMFIISPAMKTTYLYIYSSSKYLTTCVNHKINNSCTCHYLELQFASNMKIRQCWNLIWIIIVQLPYFIEC